MSSVLRWMGGIPLLLVPLTASCIIGDDVCGPNQVEVTRDALNACACAPNHVPNVENTACTPCGAFEEVVSGACKCIASYQKVNGVCSPALQDAGTGDAGTDASSGPLTGTNGQGDSCQTNSDCEGKDATWCMNLLPPFQCLVQNCANGMRACASDRVCCDLSGLVSSLAPANGLCVPTAGCVPNGGRVVTP